MKSSERLRRLIIAGGVLLIAAFAGSAAYDGWRLHQQIMSANERELGNLANALAAQGARSLQAVNVLLRDTATWYQLSGAQLPPEAIEAALASRTVGVSQVSVLTVVDASGRQRYRSRETGQALADVSDRPYFLAQRDNADAGLYINEPIVTRTERIPGLVVSRRLETPDGTFGGVVTAIVTLQQLQAMYSAIQLGKGSALLMTLKDGTIIMRQPAVPGAQEPMKLPELAALQGGPLVARVVSPMDHRPKLVATVGVGNQPLLLAVTRDEEVALRPWYDEMWSGGIRTLLLSILIVLTIAAVLRQLRRLERGEQALRQSEERYAMAMEAANEGHAEWNIPQDTVFASDKWRALHGIETKAPVASFSDLMRHTTLHPDDAPAVKTAVDDHLAGRTPAIELEYRVRHPDGEWRWIHARGRCLLDGKGAPVRLFCAATDVSARKEAESYKAGLEARLAQTQRLEALGTLAGGIAHDFNNILGAILGFGEMAQQHAQAGSALRRHIDRVMQGGARARLLVRRILDFSRSGIVERVPVGMQGIVEEAIAMLAPSLPSGLRVAARLEAADAAVMGDATQLYQVVMNLCTNAVQAMGDAGTLELSLQRVDLPHPKSLLQGDLGAGAHVCLQVEDTGGGIAPEVLRRMFDPFFTTKKVGEGTGLGLSVVHGIVSDLGGAIDVVTRQGRGTAVSVWLPVAGGSAPLQPRATADWPRGHGEVVMVVDDERPLIELAEEILAGLGYEPVGFASSESALRAFEADPRRFDAVLTDEMLPGMPGSEFARRLLSVRPALPVILMSGNVGAALEERVRKLGGVALLHKPLGLRELAECLAGALEKNRSELGA